MRVDLGSNMGVPNLDHEGVGSTTGRQTFFARAPSNLVAPLIVIRFE